MVTFQNINTHYVPYKTMRVAGAKTRVHKITCFGLPGKNVSPPYHRKVVRSRAQIPRIVLV